MNVERWNVRCCCQPQKVLGTLPAQTLPLRGKVANFANRYREMITLPIATFVSGAAVITDEMLAQMPLDHWEAIRRERREEIAYKAEGMTVEELRKIPEFQEAHHDYA